SITERKKGASVTILGKTPSVRYDRRKCHVRCDGRKEVGRYNPFRVSLELFRADTFILGGGSLLQDRSGLLTLYYYLLLIAAARLLGAKVVLFNQGIGPISGKVNYILTGFVLSFSHNIIARDRDSREYFKNIIGKRFRKKIFLGADPVFYRLPGDIRRKEHTTVGKKKIAFAVREWKNFKVKEKIKETGAKLSENYSLYNIAFHSRRDTLGNSLIKEISWSEVSDIWRILPRMDLIVGMRLHSLMCAAICGLPAVGIIYDPKVESFCRDMGIPAIQVSELSPENLVKLINENKDKDNSYKEKSLALRRRYIRSLDIIFGAGREAPPAPLRGLRTKHGISVGH
ncbi:MAG: polysaccharide pyruvyl transferase family protein, partial [Elusimicrobiota bacterium]|nr:polysaccharide pyruvyl transferase family protein [Elusimicrobiota bacterium]